MIKANELRIGNLILNRHNELDIVSDRTFQDFRFPKMDGNYGYKGIQLTEEILLMCGFTRIGKSLRLNTFEYCPISRNLVIHGHGGYYTGLILKIQYLHQLQNLYFALTGDELTVKL